MGRQVTPFSKRVVLLWFIVLGGRRVGQACGVDGREKEAKCESGDGEKEQAGPLPSVTWSPELPEELERVRSVPRVSAWSPPSASLRARACRPSLAPKTETAGQFGSPSKWFQNSCHSPHPVIPSCLLPKAFNRVG